MAEKKKKIEVKCVEDIKKLEAKEQAKWEIAVELGLFDKVVESGFRSLTSRESGRIGGILAARNSKGKKDKKSINNDGNVLDKKA